MGRNTSTRSTPFHRVSRTSRCATDSAITFCATVTAVTNTTVATSAWMNPGRSDVNMAV